MLHVAMLQNQEFTKKTPWHFCILDSAWLTLYVADFVHLLGVPYASPIILLTDSFTIDKRRTLTRMLVNDYDYNNANMIERIVRGKFVRENISDSNQRVRVCTEFADHINGLIDAISMDAIDSDEYIQNTFNNE